MKETKISLIVPAYNVERYIAKCIESCLKQDMSPDEYEIIVINDGSTDDTLTIAQKTLKDVANSRILSQNNMGLSMARNNGLKEAHGEFVWFVDSDDYLFENCLKKIYETAYGHDVLCLSYMRIYEDNNNRQPFIVNIGDSKTGQEYLSTGEFWHPAQLYVYSRSFLLDNNLSFLAGIYHEDTEFTPRMLFYASSICSLEAPVYYFLKRSNSITTTVNPKRSRDMIVVANSLNQFFERVENKKVSHSINNIISLVLNNALHELENQDLKDVALFGEMIDENKHLFANLIKSSILKYKIEGILFYLFPSKTVKIYFFLSRFGHHTVNS